MASLNGRHFDSPRLGAMKKMIDHYGGHIEKVDHRGVNIHYVKDKKVIFGMDMNAKVIYPDGKSVTAKNARELKQHIESKKMTMTLKEFVQLHEKKKAKQEKIDAEKPATRGYFPREADGQAFVNKHPVAKHQSRIGNDDDYYRAKNIKVVDRGKWKHGHPPTPEDQETYS